MPPFEFFFSNTNNIYIRIFVVARTVIVPSRWHGTLQSTFWRLYRNDDSGATLTTPNGTVPLDPDTFYVVPPGGQTTIACAREIGHFYIHFDIVGVPGITLRAIMHEPVSLGNIESLNFITRHIEQRAHQAGAPDVGLQYLIKSAIYLAIERYLSVLAEDDIKQLGQHTSDIEPVRPALDYIEAHLTEHIENAQLAQLCGLQREYFIRRFRECVGRTPIHYILERRVTLAAQLLLFSSITIEAIAQQTGLNNRVYLTRMFRKFLHETPAAYRKKWA